MNPLRELAERRALIDVDLEGQPGQEVGRHP
jgi:hypothetical protein